MKKQDKQAYYCAKFEYQLTSIDTIYCGKIDWNTVLYFYFSGIPIDEAVNRYIISHPKNKVN